MSKAIPEEYLIALHNKLMDLSARDPKRMELLYHASENFNVSISTIRRYLQNYHKLKIKRRFDYNKPRKISHENIIKFCKAIAVLQEGSVSKKGRHLSTGRVIWILENVGAEVDGIFLKLPKNTLSKCMANRYLKRLGLTRKQRLKQPVVVRFQAENSNDCWQFDFTESELRSLSKKIGDDDKKLYLASIIDDRSGIIYQEYFIADGENSTDALKFLFNAMIEKDNFLLKGIPKMIYMDNGPSAKSKTFKRVMDLLGIIIQKHLPANSDGRRVTARAKGKVERAFRSSQDQFETLFHFNEPNSLEEANLWLWSYLHETNKLPHRNSGFSRNEDWKLNLPEKGYSKMCSWEKFCQMAREPVERKVSSDARIKLDGIQYQLLPEMAGEIVTILVGVFDYEVYAEFNGEKFGPFYKSEDPIPLGTYRSFKKTKNEKQDEEISSLVKSIKIPRAIMTMNCEDKEIIDVIKKTGFIEENVDKFIPFKEYDESELFFKDPIDAKIAISMYLGKPLSILLDNQINQIEQFISESLCKKILMEKIKMFFTIRTCVND